MKLAAALGLLVALAGCASGKPELDVAQVERTCSRWCEKKFPNCAFDGAITATQTAEQATCQNQYLSCVKTCPPR